ncbi:MAG: hypothetical protein AB7F78_11630 [Hyphomicrobiaceae bacterium]
MRRLWLVPVLLLVVSVEAAAQQPSGSPAGALAPRAALPSAAPAAASAQAPLMAIVGDGLFELRQGRSVDLTRKEVLMTFVRQQTPESLAAGQISLQIVGVGLHLKVGDRLDLKRWPYTSKLMADKDSCYLDLIDVVSPKGAPATANFRFTCL